MKKMFFLILIMALSFCGCDVGSKIKELDSEKVRVEDTEKPQEKEKIKTDEDENEILKEADIAEGTALTIRNSQGDILMENQDFKKVYAKKNAEREDYYLELLMTEEGREKFSEATADNVGMPLYVLIGVEIISAPTVQQKIESESVIITGDFDKEDIINFVDRIIGESE